MHERSHNDDGIWVSIHVVDPGGTCCVDQRAGGLADEGGRADNHSYASRLGFEQVCRIGAFVLPLRDGATARLVTLPEMRRARWLSGASGLARNAPVIGIAFAMLSFWARHESQDRDDRDE